MSWRPWETRRRLWPKTLRGKLIAWFMAILLAASAVFAVATAVFLRSFLISQLDHQLGEAGGRFSASLEHGGDGRDQGGGGDGAGAGQGADTVGIRLVKGRVTQAAIVTTQGTNRVLPVSAADVAALGRLHANGGPRSLDLSAVGPYRLEAVAGRDGDVQVTGLPLDAVDDTLTRLALVELCVLVAVLVSGGVVGMVVVRRTLRPLARLTATAREVSQLPLTAADTDLPRAAAVLEPSSEVEHMDAAFANMLEHVHTSLSQRDETERRLRQFVADASHELRTPLATVRANAEYLACPDFRQAPRDELEVIARITAAADRMGHLVADLLLLARLDAGRPLEQTDVDLTRLVLETVSDARASYPDHQWVMELSGEIVQVTGDEHRLHQVLGNLLSNAGSHTPPATTVTTRLTCSAAGIEVQVVDDGPGVPALQQRELFERFTRGDGSRARSQASSGLGLAIARGIAAAHEGTLTITSAPGRGACFRLWLPPG